MLDQATNLLSVGNCLAWLDLTRNSPGEADNAKCAIPPSLAFP